MRLMNGGLKTSGRKLMACLVALIMLFSGMGLGSPGSAWAKTDESQPAQSLIVNILNPDGTTTPVHEYVYSELEPLEETEYYATIDAMPTGVGTKAKGVKIGGLITDAQKYNPDIKWESGRKLVFYVTDAPGYPYQGNNYYTYNFLYGQERYYFPNLVETYDPEYGREAIDLTGSVPVEPMLASSSYQERGATDAILKNEASPVAMEGRESFRFCMGITEAEARDENFSSTNKFGRWIYRMDVGPVNGPKLKADTTGNEVGQPIEITFTDNSAWRAAINSVKVNDSALTGEQYAVAAGKITINPGVFAGAGEYTVTVEASGFMNSTVKQAITQSTSTCTVAFSAGENGSLTAAVDNVAINSGDAVEAGKTVVFTATPAEGYQVKQWTVAGQAVAGNKTNTLNIENLAADTTVTVEFEAVPAATYTVTVDNTISGGSVAVNPVQGSTGTAITVTVTPDSGKRLVADSLKYTADNGSTYSPITATEEVYSFTLPAANVTVTARFENIGSGASVWDGSVDVSWYNPTDTVFYIDTPAKLAGLAAIVNGHVDASVTPDKIIGTFTPSANYWTGIDDFGGKTVCLTADLDMGGVYDSASGTWSGPNYTPVGGQWPTDVNDPGTALSTSFNGTLDGQGHIVKNIYCNRYCSADYKASQSIGLIGRLGCHDSDAPSMWADNPTVRNVAVTGYIYGRRSIGGIVGKIGKTNKGGIIENCANFATVRNTDSKGIGGIVGAGWNGGYIKNCYNAGSISSTYNCPSGGISGSNEINIYNCFNVGTVAAKSDSFAMGIGSNNGGDQTVSNCYWLTGSAPGGGYYQGGSNISVTEVTAEQMKSAEFLAGLNGPGCAFVADTTPNINSGYPVLAWQNPGAAPATYAVNFSVTGGNGTIAATVNGVAICSGDAIVAGKDVVFTATPAEGYQVKQWTAAGQAVADNKTNTLNVENLAANTTVTVEFEAVPAATYSVTVDNSISDGSVAVEPAQGNEGTTVIVAVTPDAGKRMVTGSLKYTTDGGVSYTEITATEGVYGFALPAANVIVTAKFENIPAATYSITKAEVPDGIWTVSPDKTLAAAGETVTVTVSDTTVTSWATGLIVTGDSGAAYDFTTVTAATGNASGKNGAGVYSFVMPSEPVTISFTADYTPLDIYIQVGAGEENLVHSYTRAEMLGLAEENTEDVYYSFWDNYPAPCVGKAIQYVTIAQLVEDAQKYNSALRYNNSDCVMRGLSLDGWTLDLTWDYLMGTDRKYYAALGDQYLAEENRTGIDRGAIPVLAITGWAGRRAQVDNQFYDTLNAYRFFYGQSEPEYGNGVLPTKDERDARCTANNTAKWVNKLVFAVPEAAPATYPVNFSVTGDNGTLTAAVESASINSGDAVEAGKTIEFTATPAAGYQVKQWTVDGQAAADNKTNTLTAENLASAKTVTVEFEAVPTATTYYTLTLSGEGLTSDPAAGAVAENTEVTITVTPAEGKQTATLTVNGTDKKAELAEGKYTFTITADTTVAVTYQDIPSTQVATQNGNIAITNNPVTITVPPGVTDTGISVTPNTALPAIKIESAQVDMTIPQGAQVSGSDTIKLPEVKPGSSVNVAAAQQVDLVIKVGSDLGTIAFTKPVKLVLKGQAAKSAGFIDSRNNFKEIRKLASLSGLIHDADTDAAAAALTGAGAEEGAVASGNDLIVWTKHFTQFIAYTPQTGSGSGGGYVTPAGQTMGSKGGTIKEAGAEISFPADAVSSDIKITVKKLGTGVPSVPTGLSLLGEVYEISSNTDTKFQKPVTVTLPFNQDKIDKDKYDAGIYCWNNNRWEPLSQMKTDLKAKKISGETEHFSKFAVLMNEKNTPADKKKEPSQNVIAPAKPALTDIAGHWAEAGITKLINAGAISGYPDGTFKPDSSITRAEFAAVLVKAFKLQPKGGKTFNDTAGHWAKDSINTAAAHGIVSGYDAGAFGPDNLITREQVAVMIVRAANLSAGEGKTFTDANQIAEWARTATAAASGKNIISGYPDGSFRPQANATRAEAAAVIIKILELM
ncbi:InlB B-repeat-containing protein [Syntrophomonas curvata]